MQWIEVPATEDPEPAESEVFLTDFVISATKPVSYKKKFSVGFYYIFKSQG